MGLRFNDLRFGFEFYGFYFYIGFVIKHDKHVGISIEDKREFGELQTQLRVDARENFGVGWEGEGGFVSGRG